jgi:integrase/recombinase XerD
MNRRTSGLSVSKAVVGFLQFKAAEGLSPDTLTSYEHHLQVFVEHVQDADVGHVTSRDVTAFLAWLQTGYKPRRFSNSIHPLASETARLLPRYRTNVLTWI